MRIACLEKRDAAWHAPVLAFGLPAIDAHLPAGGLARGALHEFAGSGPDAEHGTAATLLIGGLLARTRGKVLWVVERPDLFAPALAGVGLIPNRVIYAEAGKSVLTVMEEGLRHRGLAAVVGETNGRLTLTTSRRLQLAAESSGVIAFVIRRSHKFNDPALAVPIAAKTRWRIASKPSLPPLAHAPEIPGLGRAHWRLDLIRCRGGESSSWLLEACDAEGRLALAPNLLDRSVAKNRPSAAA